MCVWLHFEWVSVFAKVKSSVGEVCKSWEVSTWVRIFTYIVIIICFVFFFHSQAASFPFKGSGCGWASAHPLWFSSGVSFWCCGISRLSPEVEDISADYRLYFSEPMGYIHLALILLCAYVIVCLGGLFERFHVKIWNMFAEQKSAYYVVHSHPTSWKEVKPWQRALNRENATARSGKH